MEGDLTTAHLRHLSERTLLPVSHINYMNNLKSHGFEPRVIYDIGACVLHWTTEAQKVWPRAKIIAFDAFDKAEFLYKERNIPYHVGVLSNRNGAVVNWYENSSAPGGNSYYREVGCKTGDFFPIGSSVPKVTRTLDDVVAERGFPMPDFIKIDVQGAERDVLEGGSNTISHAKHMVVEMQHERYNDGAPMMKETLPWIESTGWKCTMQLHNNGPDADYTFERV